MENTNDAPVWIEGETVWVDDGHRRFGIPAETVHTLLQNLPGGLKFLVRLSDGQCGGRSALHNALWPGNRKN